MQAPASLSRREAVAWLVVLPLLLYLLLTGAGASNGTYLTPFRIVSLGILIVLFAGWAVAAWTTPAARPRTMLWPVIALMLGAQVVVTVLSPRPRLGVEYVAYGFVLAALYLLLVRLLASPALMRRIALVVGLVTLLVAAGYLFEVVALWIEWWGLVGHLAVPPTRPGYVALMYGAPGILTAFLVCAGGSSIALLWPMGRTQRAMAVAIGVLVLTATFVAAARSAWVAAALAVVATAAVGFLSGGRVRVPSSRRARVGLTALGVGAVVLAVAIGPAVARRIATGGGEAFRATLLATAARLFEQHPLTGAGLGTWVTYRLPLTQAGEQDWYIPHAHDAPLQLLAETGILGAVVAIVAILAVGHLVLRALRSGDPVRRALALGTVFVATYLFVHQLFDFFLDMPAVMFAAILPVAALDAIETRSLTQTPARTSMRALALVPAIAAFAAASFVLSLERPALANEVAVGALPSDPYRAILLEDEALATDAGYPPYLWTRGLAEAAAGDDAAAHDDLLAVADHDDLPQAWLDVAWLDLRGGDRTAAQAHLDRALRLGIQQPAIDIPAIPMLLELGRPDQARAAAAAALSSAPTLADDPWWATSPDLAALRDAAVDEALVTADPWRRWQIALLAGRADSARSLAQALPPDQLAVAGPAIDAWEGVQGARQRLEAQASADPLGGGATWAARVAEKEGDTAAADRFHRWAAIGYGTSSTDFGYDTAVTDTPDPGSQPPGPNAMFHDRYVYRRSSPADMLIGDLPRLTVR